MLSLPRPPVLWSGQPGFRDPCVPGAVGAGVGTQHWPHSPRPCGLALRAVRMAVGRLRGGCRPPLLGASGVRHSPSPGCPPSGRAAGARWRRAVGGDVGVCPTTHRLLVRGMRAWGPVTNATARALACCWGGMRVPGGGASCLGVGCPGTGALPPPTSRLFGRAAGAHYPLAVGAGGSGVGTGHQPHSTCSCVLWGRHEGARGGRLLPECGASGDGRSPTPDLSSVRACGRGPLPTGCGCGWFGVGTRHQPHSARPCALWGRHEGARGGRLLPGCGASGVGRSPTPDYLSFRACGRGPLPTGRRCGMRAWGPGCPWHLVRCRGSSCVMRFFRVRGTRWPLWLVTCPRAVVVAGSVPLWRALWPRVGAPLLVRSGRSRCSGWLSCRHGAFPHHLGFYEVPESRN